MKHGLLVSLLALGSVATLSSANAQVVRKDVIWARSTAGAAITLDGVLSEPVWAQAESISVRWGVDNGVPGSGYKPEGGKLPIDPTNATLKFLVNGNQLFLGARIPDQSIGGSMDFNRFDGLLMTVMNHTSLDRPAPPMEHFYAWWYATNPDPQPVGQSPAFIGHWATWPPGTPRDPTQIANWDAVTVVNGQSNTDAGNDVGYTVEMRFNLAADGYDVTDLDGDIVEWSVSIYDTDWFWPIDVSKFSANRTWWQNPWGNTSWYCEAKIHARPDVTVNSGPVPVIPQDIDIPSGGGFPTPVIDGKLDEAIWAQVPQFDIRYGDAALRSTYPHVGPYRSGQHQPDVNGGKAAILDPGDATVRWFHQDNTLYLGFDVRDQVVQYHPQFDRWDGFIVTPNEYSKRGPDNQLLGRRLSFQVGPSGQALAQDYLPFLRDSLGGAQVAVHLNPGTTLDTTGTSADNGYTAELAIDLTKLGFPNGLGNRTLFMGITLLDGDSFTPFTDSYGNRTWWFREFEGLNGPATIYLNPSPLVVGVDDGPRPGPWPGVTLVSAWPNPSRANSTIRYSLGSGGNVDIDLFDPQGRLAGSHPLGMQEAGTRHFVLPRDGMASGLYLYRVRLSDPVSGSTRGFATGKLVYLD